MLSQAFSRFVPPARRARLSLGAAALLVSACVAGAGQQRPATPGPVARSEPVAGPREGAAVAPSSPAQADATPAAPGGAQSPSPSDPAAGVTERLTVIGIRTPEQRRDVVTRFVEAHAAPARSGNIARWTHAVCPLTLGLSPALAAFVSDRVATLADLTGALDRAPAGCRPNVEIMFTDDPQSVADAVAAKKFGAYLGYHHVARTAALETVDRPIKAWYLTSTVSRRTGETVPDVEGSSTRPGSSLFTNVIILGDGRALQGRAIGPIADYVAMLALIEARSLDACTELPSILDLLAANCGNRTPPDGWTADDVAYLRALYAGEPGYQAGRKQNIMTEHMVDETSSPAEPGAK